MPTTRVITHRGLDPSRPGSFSESSRGAFTNQLLRGYGLEFDVRRTADDGMVVIHDSSLTRLTTGKDNRKIRSVSLGELLSMDFAGSHLTSLTELLSHIENEQRLGTISAIHIKHSLQEQSSLDLLLKTLRTTDHSKYLLFDLKIAAAKYLKEQIPTLLLAPSVAHSYDIERYSSVTGGTLSSLEEVIACPKLFDWVWLDEWDTKDKNGENKKLYTEEVFFHIRTAGMKIALVTPELHASSPGLLGGEAHEDARDHGVLMNRIREILTLAPDAVCTDYPDEVQASL